ncbi:MAG: acetyl-CoA C-acetyltransferase [Alkalilacustris sp.]
MDAFIYDALRTPRGRGRPGGGLHGVTAVRLSAQMLDAVRARSGLASDAVDDVIWGNVTAVREQGGCLARAAVLASELSEDVAAVSVNRFCASGLEAVNLAAAQVAAGVADGVIAGGVEMMSRVPMGSDGVAMAADPSIAMMRHFVPQGIAADLIATEYGFARDDLDAVALQSHARAARAWSEGRFERGIVPVQDINGLEILARDETIRTDSDPAVLAALKPAFAEMGTGLPGFDAVALLRYPHLERVEHLHTAATASAVVDGAAAVLVGSRAFGATWGLRPRARVRAMARVGSEPTIMLTGPVPATRKVLSAAGMAPEDIDLYEVNEAFAAVLLRFLQAFEVDPTRVNVNGGAIAMGHPLGATGAILLGTLLDEMERRDAATGLVTLCVAGGMGVATVIERL